MNYALKEATAFILSAHLAALALCAPVSKAYPHLQPNALPKTPLTQLFAPEEKPPEPPPKQESEEFRQARENGLLASYAQPIAPPEAEEVPLDPTQQQEMRDALRRAATNGVLKAAQETSAATQTAIWARLLRSYFESGCGAVITNKYSTALGVVQITNETCIDMVWRVGPECLEDLKKLDPSVVQSFTLLQNHIHKLEKQGSKKLEAFMNAVKDAKTPAQAKGVPANVFQAMKNVRESPHASFLLQQRLEQKQVAAMRTWMGAFQHPHLTDDMIAQHIAQFGIGGAKRLIATLQETPDKPLATLFPAKLRRINDLTSDTMTVADYVKARYDRQMQGEAHLRAVYADETGALAPATPGGKRLSSAFQAGL